MYLKRTQYLRLPIAPENCARALCGMMAAMTRVLVISDIHANQAALESVLAAAAGRYDTVWCLGDLVGYGPRPNECIEIVRERAALCVMGNHDWAVLGRPGINVDDFNPQARQAVLWTRDELTPTNRRYLESLADMPIQPPGTQQQSILVTHASPREPVWEYILTPTVALENFAAFNERVCLVGHTHKPAIYRWQYFHMPPDGDEIDLDADHDGSDDGSGMATVEYLQPRTDGPIHLVTSEVQRLIVNPGSVGQPRDNDARAAYALLDLERMTWVYIRVAYPIELTQNQMRAAKLPKRLIDRLSFGW
jgi:predicted phosphodiesterase